MLNRYLAKRPKSSYWQLRIPVPKDVQDAYGRKEVTFSLGEHDRAKAAVRALPKVLALRAEWENLRQQKERAAGQGEGSVPTENEMLQIAYQAFKRSEAALRQNKQERRASTSDQLASLLEQSEKQQLVFANEIRLEQFDRWEPTAIRLLERRGYTVDPDSDWFRQFVSIDVTPFFPPAGIRAGRLFCASARLKQWAA